MCNEFSAIYVYGGRVLWNETHSHSLIAEYVGLKDKHSGTRRMYLKVECADRTLNSFVMDEDIEEELPSWMLEYAESFGKKLGLILASYRKWQDKKAAAYQKRIEDHGEVHSRFIDARIRTADVYAKYNDDLEAIALTWRNELAALNEELKTIPGYTA